MLAKRKANAGKKSNRTGKAKTTFRFWLAYFIVIVSVLIFVLPVYVQSYTIYKNNIMDESHRSLKDGVNLLDMQLANVHELGRALRNERNFIHLSQLSGVQVDSPDYYNMHAAQKYMRAILPFSDIFTNQLFVFGNNEIVITRERIYVGYSDIEELSFRVEGAEFINWLTEISEVTQIGQFRQAKTFTLLPTGEDRQIIVYVLPSHGYRSGASNSSWMVCLIDAERIVDIIGNTTLSEYGFVRITDASGNMLLNHRIDPEVVLDGNGAEVYETQIDGETHVVMSIAESASGLRVVAGMPMSVFQKPIASMTTLMFVYLALAITVGLVVSLLMARRNSKPMMYLLGIAEAQLGSSVGWQNDYERLGYAIKRLSELKEQYRNEVEQLGDQICAGLLGKLLGGYNTEDTAEYEKHLSFLEQDYCVAVLRLHNASILERGKQTYIAKIILKKVLERYIHGRPMFYNMVPGRVVIVAPVLEWGVRDFCNSLRDAAAEFQATTAIGLTVGVSTKHSGYAAVNEGYRQAQDSLRAADAARETVMLYTESRAEEAHSPCGLSELQQLYELLCAGDERACSNLDTILEKTSQSTLTEATCRQMYYSIQCIFHFVQRDLSLPKCFGLTYSEELSIHELFENLKDSAKLLCAEVEKKKKSHNFRLKESVLEYIKSNRGDSNLCAAGVSERFGISEKYLYAFIKEQTGLTFGELLVSTRIAHAQQMLRETDVAIGEIAATVGFNSTNAFYKTFNRVCGVAPGVWRNTHRVTPSA